MASLPPLPGQSKHERPGQLLEEIFPKLVGKWDPEHNVKMKKGVGQAKEERSRSIFAKNLTAVPLPCSLSLRLLNVNGNSGTKAPGCFQLGTLTGMPCLAPFPDLSPQPVAGPGNPARPG